MPTPTSLPLLAWKPGQGSASGRRERALLYLPSLRLRLKEAVLLDGHGWGQRHGIGTLLSFFFSAALHARGGGFGQRATAEALVPSSLQSNQQLFLQAGP